VTEARPRSPKSPTVERREASVSERRGRLTRALGVPQCTLRGCSALRHPSFSGARSQKQKPGRKKRTAAVLSARHPAFLDRVPVCVAGSRSTSIVPVTSGNRKREGCLEREIYACAHNVVPAQAGTHDHRPMVMGPGSRCARAGRRICVWSNSICWPGLSDARSGADRCLVSLRSARGYERIRTCLQCHPTISTL
jgi:hypothetical protein